MGHFYTQIFTQMFRNACVLDICPILDIYLDIILVLISMLQLKRSVKLTFVYIFGNRTKFRFQSPPPPKNKSGPSLLFFSYLFICFKQLTDVV